MSALHARHVLLPAIALGIALAGCDARPEGDADAATGGTRYDANGNVVGGAPGLGAAVEAPVPELTFQLYSDATDLLTGGADTAVLTAILIDAGRTPVAGQQVSWSADGGVLQDVVATTDDNGVATASLRMPRSYRNTDVNVTVTSGPFGETIGVRAYGTTLDVQGLQRSVVAGESLEASFTLVAGDGEPIANRPIGIASAAGNTVTPAVPLTDENGVATVRIGSDAGNDTLVVTALDDPSLTQSFEFAVSADRLRFETDGEPRFDVDSVDEVRVRWTRGGAPVAFADLRVSTTAGQIITGSTVRTDADGHVVLPVSSSAAGPARITVEDLDGDPVSDFEVVFVATTPAVLDIGTTSTRVYVDGTSQLGALVRDINGNPVAGEEVLFESPNLRGGQLSPATAITNAEGKATTTFRAGSIATELDAIQITASTAAGALIADSVGLSVVERRLNVSIGRGADLSSDAFATQNRRNMVVQVADGSGAALPDASVSLAITPIEYYKGRLVPVDENGMPFDPSSPDDWKASYYAPYGAQTCIAEDVPSLNRSLDPGEDLNNNGRLDPQDPAVLAPVDGADVATLDAGGGLLTDANGTGYFQLVYPKGNANWALVRVTARASHLGTEAQDSLVTSLPALRADIGVGEGTPPNYLSPYGQAADCSDPD